MPTDSLSRGGMGRSQAWCHRRPSRLASPRPVDPVAIKTMAICWEGGATPRWTGQDRDPNKRLRRVATVNKRRTPADRATPPTTIIRLCCSGTITINYCWTPRRGNQAFLSSYVGGDRTPRQCTTPPVQYSRVESRRVGRSLMTRFDNLAWAVVAWVLTRSNWLIGIACCRHCYFSLEYCTLMFETALRFTRINNKWNEWIMNEWKCRIASDEVENRGISYCTTSAD